MTGLSTISESPLEAFKMAAHSSLGFGGMPTHFEDVLAAMRQETQGSEKDPSLLSRAETVLQAVSDQQQRVEQASHAFQASTGSLLDVMIETNKANLLFQATVEVRNKLLNAYQEIWNMTV